MSKYLTYNGRTETVEGWTRILGFSHGLIKHRLDNGWSVLEALSTPAQKYYRKMWIERCRSKETR
jgi:hypothetical protein